MADQTTLQNLWKAGRPGTLSQLEQVRVWAARDALSKVGTPSFGMHGVVAGLVEKIGGGHPTTNAIRELLERIDGDPEWFPGKSNRSGKGPPKALSKRKQATIARVAMTHKKAGKEPTYSFLMSECPEALENPATGLPVTKKRAYDVMREHCFDDVPEKPWKHRKRLQKSALPDSVQEARLVWATRIRLLGHTGAWYFRHVIFVDLCNSILPRSAAKASEQALARKGKSGWISEGSQQYSRNLKGKQETLKQKSWDTERVWWAPVLCRGKLHIEVLPRGFPGENPAGAGILARQLPKILKARFPGASLPRVVLTDRGRGFFNPGTGHITSEFKSALDVGGLRPFAGANASEQPGNLSEVFPHETAVAWIRHLMTRNIPKNPWTETYDSYAKRLRKTCKHINREYEVDSLCRSFPDRIDELIFKGGDKLRS